MKLSLLAVGISVVGVFIILSRLAYVPFLGDNDVKERIFGYPSLSSFLYSIGMEISFLLIGITFWYSTNYMYERAKAPFRLIGGMMCATSFYFMSWIFIEERIFSKKIEVLISLGIAVISTAIFLLLLRLAFRSISRLYGLISYLLNTLVDRTYRFVPVEKTEEYDEKIVWPAIKKTSDETK